jgi:ABC-type uncharacterized transport system permease subunit
MNIRFFGIAALLLYSIGFVIQARTYVSKTSRRQPVTLIIALLALASHGVFSYHSIYIHNELDLSFFKASTAISFGIVFLITLVNLIRPLQIQTLIIYPIAALSIGSALLFRTVQDDIGLYDSGLLIHIVLSILAYGLLSLAAIQAALIYAQNKSLKSALNSPLLSKLPPLLEMENALFEMLWAGFILLSLAIASGFLFIDNMLEQHLVHKTVFSIMSWLTFAALLIGRHRLGWRGATASKWTLWGCFFLMLGYFGTKMVLELILNK